MILGSLLTILGFQAVMTGLFAKAYCHAARLYAPDRMLEAFRRHFSLERGLIAGTVLVVAGFLVDAKILIGWLRSGMGALNAIRPATRASTLMIIGAQIVFSSFFLSLLGMFPQIPMTRHRSRPSARSTKTPPRAIPPSSVAHILFVYDCLYPHTIGGFERFYRDVTERLARSHEVTLSGRTRVQWDRDQSPDAPPWA